MAAPIVDHAPHWLDPVAVERALNRKPVGRTLHRAERIEITRRVLARGGSITHAANLMRMNNSKLEELLIGTDLEVPRDRSD